MLSTLYSCLRMFEEGGSGIGNIGEVKERTAHSTGR